MRGHHVGLDYHRGMLDDPWRVDAYDRAIRQLVRPGDVVLDLGCGTGLLSLLAARRGARVHAVESADVIAVARQLVAHNGLSDRVTLHHSDFVELDVIEPVDWVVSDFLGRFVVDDQMADAVQRAGHWLRPGGRFVPGRVTMQLAPVGGLLPMVDRWRTPLLGLDLSPALQTALHSAYPAQLAREQLLAPAQDFAVLEPPAWPSMSGRHTFLFARAGRFMGVAGFFTAALAPGVRLSTAPGVQTHWGQYLFPVEPRWVEAGEELGWELAWEDEQWRWQVDFRGERWGAHTGTVFGEPVERSWQPDPAALQAENNRGAALHVAGDLPGAVAAFEAAAAVAGPASDEAALALFENLGLAYLQSGLAHAAVQALLRAEGGPQAEAARQWLVAALEHAGRPLDAARLRDPDPER